ncbi:azurin [Pseudomonas capeferrum]|uniref:azurin n=1 Tax=Pseudomonas capeferrum TaxID=1495066 RepID=UPI0015E35458|nr:azurin [Pseudomonas capeferrum]MBA1200384.1 azurin [Pseudomonas capeferrum]
MRKALFFSMWLSSFAFADDCQIVISSNDQMQYDQKNFTIPKQCKNFQVTLQHTGNLPKVAMGHNLVIVRQSDLESVATEALAAGPSNGYLKPDDARVIAHTPMIGGGEKAQTTIDVTKLNSEEEYLYFCSFPGHYAMMKGKITIEK